MDRTYTRTTVIVVGLIVAAVAFLAGLWIGKDSDNAESTPTPSVEITRTPVGQTPSTSPRATLRVIHMLEQGVSPRSLTLRVGDAVTFINDSSRAIWLQSSDCSDLDSRRSLNNGESYTLTMRTRATCTYYNSLAPSSSRDSGTIVVQ